MLSPGSRSLGPLGPHRAGPAHPPLPERHERGIARLRLLRDRAQGVLAPTALRDLQVLLDRLHSGRSIVVPPDAGYWRSRLVGLSHEALSSSRPSVADDLRDLLITLFGPYRPDLADRCQPGLGPDEVLGVHAAITTALIGGNVDAVLQCASPALIEISYALGHNHDALLRRLRQTWKELESAGARWFAPPITNCSTASLQDNVRCRVIPDSGAHGVRLSADSNPAIAFNWDPIYGRIEGICTIVGFDLSLLGAI